MRPSPLSTTLKRTAQAAVDLLYPPRCAACAARLPTPDAPDFCAPCQALLEPIEGPRCEHCSEPWPGKLTGPFHCPNCHGLTFSFDFAISAWHSNGPLREAIHRFKYGHKIHLRLPLARKLMDTLDDPRLQSEAPGAPDGLTVSDGPEKSPGGPDNNNIQRPSGGHRLTNNASAPDWHLVPVPLHARRLRERRFNQSAELARTLAKLSGLPVLDLLHRSRYTTAQATLTRKQRLENLAGAFTLKPRAPQNIPSHILLVDDVFTTGSTAHECALALKKAGAHRIAVLTVARG